MKKNLLIFLLLVSFNSFSQVPGPPGIKYFSVIDQDYDGYTSFNIDYYTNTYIRNLALQENNFNVSGYSIEVYTNSQDLLNGTNALAATFTNTVIFAQDCYLKFVYNGTGTQYNEADLNYYYGEVTLQCVDPNGDIDNDSVLNNNEDLNGNLILIDTDTDADGRFNFKDNNDDGDTYTTINEDYNGNGNPMDDDLNSNTIPDYLDNLVSGNLLSNDFFNSNFKLYPNPTYNFIVFEISTSFNLEIFDTQSKLISKIENCASKIDVSNLESGIYFFKIEVENNFVIKKVVKF